MDNVNRARIAQVPWLPDELLLVADAVRLNGWSAIRANTAAARDLSALLNRGQLHTQAVFPDDFRSASSIQRKSYDLLSASAGYDGIPTRGGRLAQGLLDELRADETDLASRASAIRRLLFDHPDLKATSSAGEDPDEEIAAHEGGLVETVVLRRERDRGLRNAKIAKTRADGAPIACEVCGFTFGDHYGERGTDYIEVHHVRPLHVSGEIETSLTDLALLCANCHRMCHRGPWITPDELSRLIGSHLAKAEEPPTV